MRPAHGVKIVFASEDGRVQTLYYFSTNVANESFKDRGLRNFVSDWALATPLSKALRTFCIAAVFLTFAISYWRKAR